MPVSGTSFTVRTLRESREEAPRQTHTHTQTSSHCMGHSRSLKVRDRSLLLSSGCLSVADSLLKEPASEQPHYVCLCVYMSVFLFSCFELWLQEVSGLQPVAQGLPDSPSLQRVRILPVDYHIISTALASHYWWHSLACCLSAHQGLHLPLHLHSYSNLLLSLSLHIFTPCTSQPFPLSHTHK